MEFMFCAKSHGNIGFLELNFTELHLLETWLSGQIHLKKILSWERAWVGLKVCFWSAKEYTVVMGTTFGHEKAWQIVKFHDLRVLWTLWM